MKIQKLMNQPSHLSKIKTYDIVCLCLSSRRSQRLKRKKRLNYEDLNDHPDIVKKHLTSMKELNLAPSIKRKKFLTDETLSDHEQNALYQKLSD
jgi:hypothetical protein